MMNAEKKTKSFTIRRLEANQIGPFAQLNMSFPEKCIHNKAEIHILTGENGTGKSTVLQMFANCAANRSQLLYKKMWIDSLSNYKVVFSDDSSAFYDENLISSEDKFVRSSKKGVGNSLPDDFPLQLKKWAYEDSKQQFDTAFFAYSGYRKLADSTIDSISEPKSSPFENALDFDKSTDAKTFVNWVASVITKNAIAYSKKNPQDRERAFEYHKPIAELETVIANITGCQIEFELQESPLAVLIHVNEQPLEFEQLPDGLKSIVSWLGDLIMRLDRIQWATPVPLTARSFILFLDEIEIHLHPSWQRKILPVVQQLFVNAQIFVSTHSPFVVGSVDGAWVHRFVKYDRNHSRLQSEPILSEDSYSYDYILSEIFGVKERFGIEVEHDLHEFKSIKSLILRGSTEYDVTHFEHLISKLLNQSSEIQSIIGMELRQLSRLTNRTFV